MYKMMNLETKEQLILAKAIDAFQKTTGQQIAELEAIKGSWDYVKEHSGMVWANNMAGVDIPK